MNREYRAQQISITPIETGYLIDFRPDGQYYNEEKFAFATWAEVVDFVKDRPVDFVAVSTEGATVAID